MSDFKVVFEDDEWVEYEFTQPNDLLGDTFYWDEEDWKKWNEKMERLEQEGTKGQLETFRVKLNKNPFIDGQHFIRGQVSESPDTVGDNDEEESSGDQ